MIGCLNLKGRELMGSISDIFNKISLKEYIRHQIIIDSNREKILGQDALEMCWTLSKA